MRELHAVLDAAAHVRVREVDLAPAHGALGVGAVAHAALAAQRELRRRIAREHARHDVLSIGRANVSGSTSSLPSAVRSSSRKRSRAFLGGRAEGEHVLVQQEQRRRAIGFQQRLRQQLVARLFLELALRAPARLLLHALAVLGEPYVERLVDGGRRQHAHLIAQAKEIRAGDAACERLPSVAGRRLEARAALGVGAARLERGGRELLGQRLLGVGPRARHGIETDAAKHRRALRKGRAVSRFALPLSIPR